METQDVTPKLKGQLWRIEDVRKGFLTIRLHTDVPADTEWFDADLEEGEPSYVSNETRIGVFSGNKPVTGQDAMAFRQCLVRWLELVNENPAEDLR